MSSPIGFRATDEDLEILATAAQEGESNSDVIRRALRLLGREAWMQRARADAERLAHEDLTDERAAW